MKIKVIRGGALLMAAVAILAPAPSLHAAGFAEHAAAVMDATWMFAAGLALVLLELFLFPGHGVAALPGLALMGWSGYATITRLGLEPGLEMIGLELVGGMAITAVALKLFPLTPGASALLHSSRIEATVKQQADQLNELDWVGRRGEATSDLRPAGSARFADRRLDVVSETGYLKKGEPVEITRFEDGRIIVKASKSDS